MGREKLLTTLTPSLARSLTAGTVATMCAISTLLTSSALLCRCRSRFSFLAFLHRRSFCVHSYFINPADDSSKTLWYMHITEPPSHCVCATAWIFVLHWNVAQRFILFIPIARTLCASTYSTSCFGFDFGGKQQQLRTASKDFNAKGRMLRRDWWCVCGKRPMPSNDVEFNANNE